MDRIGLLLKGLFLVSLLTSVAASVHFKGDPLVVESCTEGVTIKNNCNDCVCTQNHVYECSSNSSNECEDKAQARSQCEPNVIYVLNNTICICNGSGLWPHDQCKKTFHTLGLPLAGPLINCKPNSYVRYNCNVCRCGSDGKLKNDRCTKIKCKNSRSINYFAKSRRLSQRNDVYGNCDVKNWYSLAPCQFCFCVNENRLVCNNGNSYSHKIELGAYNLSVCGKELIREAIDLIPDEGKALRYGMDNKTIESAKPGGIAKEITLHENTLTINVNHDKKNTNNKEIENDEYYTDTEEEAPPEDPPSIPPLPYNQENPNVLRKVKTESEQEFETDNEIGVEIEAKIEERKETPVENIGKKTKPRVQPYQQPAPINYLPENLGQALKLSLPMVLYKVFQMALEKSMISVVTDDKCTPGGATVSKCNVCFCIKEYLLLCTNDICE